MRDKVSIDESRPVAKKVAPSELGRSPRAAKNIRSVFKFFNLLISFFSCFCLTRSDQGHIVFRTGYD